MLNSNLARIIDEASRNTSYNSYEINNRRKYIDIIIKRIKEIAKEDNIKDEKELKKRVLNNLGEEMQQYCDIANVQGRYFQIEAAEEIIDNKALIGQIYEYIIKYDDKYTPEEEYEGAIYDASLRKSCRTFVGETLRLVRITERRLDDETRKIIKQYNGLGEKEKRRAEKILKHKINLDLLKLLARTIEGSYVDKINETAKIIIPKQKEELKESQIQTMEYLFERFKEYSLLERYKKDNDRNMEKCGLTGYTYELSTGKYSKNDIGIEEVFSREFLEQLDLEDVIMLSTYWQNRYSKERQDLGEAIFAIDTLDLWGPILKGESITISDKEIQGVANKIQCVRKISTNLLKQLEGKQSRKNLTEESLETGYTVISDEEEINQIAKQEGKRYERIYSDTDRLPSSRNDLESDLYTYKLILNQVENIYLIRNSILGCTIRSLLNSKKCKNWGLIIEDTEKSDSEYVLIGIDYEGLNMPVRFHIKKELLITFLRTYKGQTKIPVYEGDKDFIIDGKVLPTNILMPTNPRLKAILRKPEGDKKVKEHLMFVADSDKYPENLKVTVKTHKGMRKIRPPRRYADLVTEEEFLKLENGEYKKIEGLTGDNKGDGR